MKPVIKEIPFRNPFSAYQRLFGRPHSFFLDSAMASGELGRFSFIGADPFLIFKAKGRDIHVNCQGWKKRFRGNPFYILREMLKRYKSDFRDERFPFSSGALGYFSYDLKNNIEKLPDMAIDDQDTPDCSLGFYDLIIIFDNFKKKAYISSTGFPELGEKRILRAKARLEKMEDIASLSAFGGTPRNGVIANEPFDIVQGKLRERSNLKSTFTKSEYIKTIHKAKEYIKQGDIYQVNLSQRFHAPLDSNPFELYSLLREINPAPFGAYLNFDDVQILSASPERFIKLKNKNIYTRPIKGTRPRGKTKEEDVMLKNRLISSVKDRAENLMIIDLERNDLGRISEYGSVSVSEFMKCEEFPTVFHLTSEIKGILSNNKDAIDVLMNCFPGGSITGAPKIRSMEIIEELEPVKRGIYTGSVGYIDFNGDMDTSIVIRTIMVKNNTAYFSVGGGIVHDSNPEKEYEETLHKAKALIEAISGMNNKIQMTNAKGTTGRKWQV